MKRGVTMDERSASFLFNRDVYYKTGIRNEWDYNCASIQISGNMNYVNPSTSYIEMEFVRRTEDALKRIDEGYGTKLRAKDFLKELETW